MTAPRARFVSVLLVLTAGLVAASAARADDGEPGEQLRPPQVPTGWVIIEGDILVRASDIGKPNPGRFSTFQADKTWPGGVVPFAYDTSVTNMPTRKAQADAAMALLAAIGAGTNIQFVPRTNQTDYIEFVNDNFSNFSPVGRQGGRQDIHVVSWGNALIICHETMHSLGFYHEQSRSDRDTYVTVHTENVCDTCCNHGACAHNFQKETSSAAYGPYDFDSIMHYGKCDFIWSNMPCTPQFYTIVVNAPYAAQWQDKIGQRDHLSRMDRLTLSFLYALSTWRFVDGNVLGLGSGTFLDPWDSFALGVSGTPSGGRMFVSPGTYYAPISGRITTPMTINAPFGGVQVQRPQAVARAAAR